MHTKYRILSLVVVIAILLSLFLTAQTASAQNQAVKCGTWSIKPASQKPKDSWIEVVLVSSSTTDDCSANFRIINKTGIETGVWDTNIGGYSFELTAIAGSSVTSWTEPWKPRGLAFLSPSLDAGMIATPLSKSSEAIITLHGDVTIESFSFDLALFVLGSVLTNAAGKTCLLSISEDQITLMAIRVYGILNTAANLTLSGDIAGALDELRLVFDEVLGRLKDGATDAGAECAVKGLVKLSPLKKSEILAQIVFDFIVWDGKLIWDLIKLPGSPTVLLVYTPATPTPTPMPTQVSYELPPLDRQDYYSVLQWVKYALANNYMDVFRELITEDLAYVSYIEGSDPVTRREFLDALEARLPSRPHCDSFMIYSDSSGDRLDILSTGWSPKWVMDQLCHAGCDKLNPPATTDIIAFALHNKGDGWRIAVIPFGERPDWFAGTLRTQVISCDTVQTLSSFSSTSISSNLLPLNRAEYFSVLQWIKYASLYNDISAFEQLIVGDSIQLIDGNGKTVTISKADFLGELSKRLVNKPNCDFFMFEESGRLIIRMNGWSLGWGVNGDSIVYLILEQKNNQWMLTSIIYGDHPPSWAQGLERISFDTISLSAGTTTGAVCQEARPTRLKIGDFAFVSFYPPLNQRVRSGPGTSNSILDVIPVGSAVKILDGPECADNWVWWKVRVLSSKLEGWTSEGDKDAYWLIPCESREGCGTQ